MSTRRLQAALEAIGHEELFQNFEDEGLDDEALNICLEDEGGRKELKKVCSSVGVFIKFQKAYKSLRNLGLEHENGTSLECLPSIPTSPTLSSKQSVNRLPSNEELSPPKTTSGHLTNSDENQNNANKSSKLEPVQIIDLILKAQSGVDTQLVLKERDLTQILLKVQNRRVALLSIAGPSRQVKSFILSYMIKYLRHVSGGRRSFNWMGESESEREAPLQDAFPWRNGVDPETTGMSMWPEPFTLTSNDGSEFDVLLVDTQGVFDHYTEEKDWATIVGLSLLTSSALIFNISKQLQENSLKSLKGFMDFGLMAMDSNNGGEKPFQSLTFLIRDWNNASEYSYGARGGAEYLKYQLGQKHTVSGRKIREQIKDSFEQLHCFLMPDPGENVKDKKYDGSVAKMNDNFASSIKEFIETLFDPNTFPLMTILGNPVTGLDLLTYFKKYVEIFNSDKVPSSEDMNRAMNTICNQTVVNKSVAVYESEFAELKQKVNRSFLLDKELIEFHVQGLIQAMDTFDSSCKMGSESEINESKIELSEVRLQNVFNNFTLQNKENFRAALETETEGLKINFEESAASQISAYSIGIDNFVSEETLDRILKVAEGKAMKTLQYNLQIPDLSPLEAQLDSISRTTKTMCDSVRNRNQLLKSEAKFSLNKFLQDLVQSFTDQLTQSAQGQYVKMTDFAKCYNSALAALKSEFSRNYQTSSFFKDGEAHLLEKTDAVRIKILQKIEAHQELLRLSCKEKLHESQKNYERNMNSEFATGNLLQSFSKCHTEAKRASILSFTNSEPAQKLPPAEVEALKLELISRLAPVCADFALKSIKEKRGRLLAGFKNSLQAFDQRLDMEKTLVEVYTLQKLYAQEKLKASQGLRSFLRDIESMGTAPNTAETSSLTSDIDQEAELHQKTVLTKNEALQFKFEMEVKTVIKESADAYATELKGITKWSETEADFKEKAMAAMTKIVKDFERKCKSRTSPSLSSVFLLPLRQELKGELERRRDQELKNVLFKLQQDELQLKYVVPEVKRAYRDEMEKVFERRKNTVSLMELCSHHTRISEIVLDHCIQNNELPSYSIKELREELDVLYKGFREKVKRHNNKITPAIGIDLGTTYSSVAVIRAGNVEVIQNTLGESTTPSYVHFPEGGGRPVVAGAKSEASKDPKNTVFDAKRFIGRKYTDPVLEQDMKSWPFKVVNSGNWAKIQIHGTIESPERISSLILSYLQKCAQRRLNVPEGIKNAVITVPTYFNEAQRQATKDAAEFAGLNVLKILTEPIAAAIAYGLDDHNARYKNVLIYDLGSRKLDVTVLHIKKGEVQVKAVGGDIRLGGEDFDNKLVNYCLEDFWRKTGIDVLSVNSVRQKVLRRLRDECEKGKCQLSGTKVVHIRVEKICENYDLDVRMTRDIFEGLCAHLFYSCIAEVEKTLKEAKLTKTDIDDIVLVGGCTQIPRIKEMLKKCFNGKILRDSKSPDEIVAHGAAMLACTLNPGQEDNQFCSIT